MAEVWIRRRRWRIVEERRGPGITCLRVAGRQTGESRSFLIPHDTAVADRRRRPRRVGVNQALARLAGHITRASFAFTPDSIVRDTIDILPFQLEPALAALAGRRRLLIADGVGMGKTVQAGVLLSAVIARDAGARALVVAPGTLLPQWSVELESRFSLTTHRADTPSLARLRSLSPYLANPWTLPGVWLTSPDFLKQPHIIDGLPAAPWDLIVIDEAHQLAGDTQRHDAIHRLAIRAAKVVLLTATPHDGDDERFRRLLSVGSRGDALTTFRRTRVADTNRRRVRWLAVGLSGGDCRILDAIDAFERAVRPARSGSLSDALPLICAVFRRRALSSRDALRASLARRLAILESGVREPRDTWRQPGLFDSDLFSSDETEALEGDSGMPAARERSWLLRLQHLSGGPSTGGRARGLETLLRRRPDPAVVFTHYRDSLQAIVGALPLTRQAAVMHGGLTVQEQQRALEAFLAGSADTLVATDIASQGLNLHTASRWAISFDVPWTPLRLEQRVGRVDRIGQRQRVHATILTSRHPYDRELRSRLEARAHQSAHAPLASCRRWARATAGMAAWYQVQRRIAEHWQHPAEPDACEAIVTEGFTQRWLGHVARGVACYEITLGTTTGAVIERRIVTVDIDAPLTALVAHWTRRARVLTHRLGLRAAVLGRAQPPLNPPAQPGLFDRRTPQHTIARPSSGTATDRTLVIVGQPRLLVRFLTRTWR